MKKLLTVICVVALTAPSWAATKALPSQCIVTGSDAQIYIENGFARGINDDGTYNGLYQSVQSSVAWYVGDFNGKRPLAIYVVAGFGNENAVSPDFYTSEEAGACLRKLVKLFKNRVTIVEGGAE